MHVHSSRETEQILKIRQARIHLYFMKPSQANREIALAARERKKNLVLFVTVLSGHGPYYRRKASNKGVPRNTQAHHYPTSEDKTADRAGTETNNRKSCRQGRSQHLNCRCEQGVLGTWRCSPSTCPSRLPHGPQRCLPPHCPPGKWADHSLAP